MRIRVALLGATVAAVLAAAPLPASAAAHKVLTNGRVGGRAVKVGAILRAGLKSGTQATLFAPGTKVGVRCRSASVTDKVTRNPAAPGTAVESLRAQKFARCSTDIPGTTAVRNITVLGLPYRTTVSDSAGHPVTIFRARTRLTLNTVLGPVTCTFRAARLRGTASNTGQVIVFRHQRFTLSGGSSACPKAGSFSATFGPVRNFSVRGRPHVFVN
jgi:hypothetical protein